MQTMKRERFDTIAETFVKHNGVLSITQDALKEKGIRISLSQLVKLVKSKQFDTWVLNELETKSTIIKIKVYTSVLHLIEQIEHQLNEDESLFSVSDRISFFSKLLTYINAIERTTKTDEEKDPVENLKLKIKREHEIQDWRNSNTIKI